MRRFTLGSGTDRKTVVIELNGTRMSVAQMMPDASVKRSVRDFGSDAEARSASDQMARELVSRGYSEALAHGPKPAETAVASPKPAARKRQAEAVAPSNVFDDALAPAAASDPVLPRLARATSVNVPADDVPQKKKKAGGKKKKKKGRSDDVLDKRVLAGIGAVGVAFVGIIAYVVFDFFIKPPTIVGVWRGGMVEHEISRSLTLTEYELILDAKRQAALAIERPGDEPLRLAGTYVVTGNRLKLAVTDEDGDPGDREYKIVLSRVTLELIDPTSGKLLVQLLRSRDKPVVRPHTPKEKKNEPGPPVPDPGDRDVEGG